MNMHAKHWAIPFAAWGRGGLHKRHSLLFLRNQKSDRGGKERRSHNCVCDEGCEETGRH